MNLHISDADAEGMLSRQMTAHNLLMADIWHLLQDRATLLTEVERLRKALSEYATHPSHCAAADRTCTCGLKELLQ